MEMEQEHINQDQSDSSESQPPQPDKKHCKYCQAPIYLNASVCQHCRYHQRWWLNYFQQFGFLVSIGLLGLSFWQFTVALQQRAKADDALQRASEVEQVAKQTKSLLDFNFLLTKAGSDDRKAFDEVWAISQTPGHVFQDLARGAVQTLVWSNITLPQQPVLVEELQLMDHSELLNYYRQTPHVHSGSVLVAVNHEQNKRMTEEEKADFLAVMIDEDISFHIVQRACMYIKPKLEMYRQVKPVLHDRAMDKCKIYGKLWGY
jgi:hypothetical protein